MLAEMARQAVDRAIESDEGRHARMRLGQTSLLDLWLQLERVGEIAAGK